MREGLWEGDAQWCGGARLQDGLYYLNLISFKKKKVKVNSLAQTRSPPVFLVSSSGPKPAVGVVRPPLWWGTGHPSGLGCPRVVPRGDLSHWERPCPGHADPLQPRPL